MTINLEQVLHETLIGTGHVECCAVFGRKDCSVRATSMGYQVHSVGVGMRTEVGGSNKPHPH